MRNRLFKLIPTMIVFSLVYTLAFNGLYCLEPEDEDLVLQEEVNMDPVTDDTFVENMDEEEFPVSYIDDNDDMLEAETILPVSEEESYEPIEEQGLNNEVSENGIDDEFEDVFIPEDFANRFNLAKVFVTENDLYCSRAFGHTQAHGDCVLHAACFAIEQQYYNKYKKHILIDLSLVEYASRGVAPVWDYSGFAPSEICTANQRNLLYHKKL